MRLFVRIIFTDNKHAMIQNKIYIELMDKNSYTLYGTMISMYTQLNCQCN